MGGQDYDALKALAATRDFKPVPLGVDASITLHNKLRTIDSTNVIARLEGSDPALKDEDVVYMAHWDHLGIGEPVNGDAIYNGAMDNASGVAGLLEIAHAFTKLAAQAEADDRVCLRDRRGAGLARLGVLRGQSDLCRWRRRSPTSTWTA